MMNSQYPLRKVAAVLTKGTIRARLDCGHIVVVLKAACTMGDEVACYHCHMDPILDHHARLAFDFRDDLESPYLREAIRTPVLLEEEG